MTLGEAIEKHGMNDGQVYRGEIAEVNFEPKFILKSNVVGIGRSEGLEQWALKGAPWSLVPKKPKTVKMWRWELLSESDTFGTFNKKTESEFQKYFSGWTKVPGSERTIEVPE